MKLSEHLNVDAVCVNLESGERDAVIAELRKILRKVDVDFDDPRTGYAVLVPVSHLAGQPEADAD